MIIIVGVIINSLAISFGGLVGAFLGKKIPEPLRVSLPLTFGPVVMGLGVNFIVKMNTLPALVLVMPISYLWTTFIQ